MRKGLAALFVLVAIAATTSFSLANRQEDSHQEGEDQEFYPFRDEAEIRSALEQVLSAGEYRRLGRSPSKKSEAAKAKDTSEAETPTWLRKLWDWLARWLSARSSENERKPSLRLDWIRWLVYAFVTLALVAVVALTAKAVLRRAAEKALPAEAKPEGRVLETSLRPPGELPSPEYLARALALAEATDYRAAIRQLLLGTMSWIERHGLIRYRRGLSNRDYLRAVAKRPTSHESLHKIVLHFEQVYFGRRSASARGFQECLDQYRRSFATD